jgi:23S rRNA-/tRNA-specific pseudouridylate synthase
MVALVILSVGIVVVLQAFQTAVTALSQGRDILLADTLARGRVARAEAAAAAGTPPSDSSGRFEGDFGSFLWSQEARRSDETVSPSAYEFAVTVWREGERSRHTLRTTLRPAEVRP